MIPGTIVNDLNKNNKDKETVRLGHTSGVTKVEVKMKDGEIISGGVTRTARRIMDGFVYIRD